MTDEQRAQVESIFGAALEMLPLNRESYVRGASPDPMVRAEVLSLLGHDVAPPGLQVAPAALRASQPSQDWSRETAPLTGRLVARFPSTLEDQYRRAYSLQSLPRVRAAMLLAIVLYSSFAFLDNWVAPNDRVSLWMIRAAVVAATAVAYALSFRPSFARHWQGVISMLVAFGAAGILQMIAMIPEPGSYLYYAGLLLIIVYYATLIRLSFPLATTLSTGIVLGYTLVAIVEGTPWIIVLSNIMMLLGGNVIALWANVALDHHSRRDYWQRERLIEANAELERSREEIARAAERNDLLYAALTEALPGTVLDGKYRLEEKIGAGGFGTVYRAFHLGLRHHVAVKLLRPTGDDLSRDLERFRREGIAACRLVHPNAVQVLDLVVSNAVAYLVMELLKGRSLAQELAERGAMSPQRCAEIVCPLCAALAIAHDRGLVHRDLKPSNIFLHSAESGETVKLIDFGLARMPKSRGTETFSLADTSVLIGTPAYMSPERLEGGESGPPSDIYSLGVIVIEMLTGSLPGGASRADDWVAAVARRPAQPPCLASLCPTAPAAMAAVVDRALLANPLDRPSAREFAAAFAI